MKFRTKKKNKKQKRKSTEVSEFLTNPKIFKMQTIKYSDQKYLIEQSPLELRLENLQKVP